MRTEKIANRQLLLIVYMIRSTVIIATLPVLTSADALQDAWVAAIITYAGTVVIINIIAGLGVRYPQQTLVEFAHRLLGKWPGKAVAMLVLWSFLHLVSVDIRIYGEMILSEFLTETPLVFVISTMVLLSAYAAYMGVEVIGRLADLFFPVFVLMVVASLLATTGAWRPENLQPVLARGLGPPLRASVTPIAVSAELMVLAILIPSLTQPREALKTSLVAITLASLTLVLVAAVVVATLGAEAGARSVFPFLRMIRSVGITEFLERVEAFATLAWGLGLFITVSTFMFCGARGIAQVFGVQDYRPLVLPMAVPWVVLSIHSFEDMFQLRTFFQPRIFGPYGLALILVPYGLLWAGHAFQGLLHPEKRKRL
ncbi:MAG: endospore germination permease [Bacillota bacterium]